MKRHYVCILASVLCSAVFAGQQANAANGNEERNWSFPQAQLPSSGKSLKGIAEDQPGSTVPEKSIRQIPKKKGLPPRLAQSEDILLGYNWTTIRGKSPGMYKLNFNGSADWLYCTPYEEESGYEFNLGWLQKGNFCALIRQSFFDISDYRYLVMEPATGKILSDTPISLKNEDTGLDYYLPLYISCAYDPTDNTLWGYSTNEKGTGYAFFTAAADDVQHTEAVVPNEQWEHVCASLCYNEKENALVGINRDYNLVRVERDGSQTLIMDLGVSIQYQRAALMYDPLDDVYLWNAQLSDDGSYLYCIDPKNNEVYQIVDYDSSLRLPFLGTIPASSDPAPVATPIIDKVDFGKGQNNGSVTFFMPKSYYSGAALSGELSWTVYIDNSEYKTGTAKAGEKVTVECTDIENGNHDFAVDVKQGDKKSSRVSKSIFIGYDKPKTPTNVTMDATTIAWEPVVRGVKGGYMDMANLKYHVYINGEEVGVTVADNKFVYSSDTERPYAGYSAYVVADNNGILSDESEHSDIFTYGQPWDMDVQIAPTPQDVMAFSAFDLNEDANVWSYVEYQGTTPTIREPLASSKGTDDWLFTPPLNFDDSATSYEISLDVMNAAKWYKDLKFEAYLCSELNPEKVVEKLIDYTPGDEEFHRVSQVFTIADPGTYYIAFYSKHDAYKSGILIKDINIKKTNVTAPLPAAVTELSAVGAPKAELKATLKFTMPETFVNGNMIPAETDVEIIIEGNKGETTVNGKPGEKMSVDVETQQGNNEFKVIPSIDGVKGKSSIVTVYCGYDVPGPASNLVAYVSEDNLSITLKWEPPTTVGDNGYYVDPAQCGYVVMLNTTEGWIEYETLDSDTFEYTFTVAADSGLKSEWIGIAPVNVAGRATTYAWMSDMLGTPYSLPVTENFKGGQPTVKPVRIIRSYDTESTTQWDIASPGSIVGDDTYPIALTGTTTSAPATGCLMLPKFSTKGVKDAGMRIGLWTGTGMADISILGETYGVMDLIEIASIPAGEGWREFEIRFPEEMQDRQWITVFLMADYRTVSNYILVSGYSVGSGFTTSAVENPAAEKTTGIYGGENIRVVGHEGDTVRIYATDGRLVNTVWAASASEEIQMAPGLYIVTADGVSSKVIVY